MSTSIRFIGSAGLCALLLSSQVIDGQQVAAKNVQQPGLGYRSVSLLKVDGLEFKDLNRNGTLDPFEDWRLSPEARTADLLGQMTLEEQAGVMVHGTLPTGGALGAIGRGDGYDMAKTKRLVTALHVNSFITRLSGAAQYLAEQNNAVQALAEETRLGIPATISTDPRHHFQEVLGASSAGTVFSQWPEPLGFGAIDDAALTRRFGDIARQEYAAVGIREALSPQADLVTEPRWARANGTFGEDPALAKRMVKAYVEGFQGGDAGLSRDSVMAVVKHWVGYGAEKDGWDGHNYYGRFAAISEKNLQMHIVPFIGAFEAHVAGVMPTYAILEGATVNGKPLEQVGAGFSKQLLQELLRDKYKFSGVVVSDWGITSDCNEGCKNGVPASQKAGTGNIGMPWGVEGLTKEERFAKTIGAGVDQIGGTEESGYIVDAVHHGKLTEARVREAAGRVLLQKFQMGLFEQPYADAAKASSIVGRAEFVREGEAAQAKAVVVLENKSVKGKALLPVASGKKVFLVNVKAEAAKAAGFTVVEDVAQADFAIVRAPAPYQGEHPGYFFGGRQHEGRLNFVEADTAYAELLRVGAVVPTIFTTTLERPLILTNVKPHATVLLGDFGIGDEPLLEVITGKVKAVGKLPFELPSSIEAVQYQKSDVPHDSAAPLYRFGYGLKY
ncbi:MAG: glycoside hydrolase family 3 domain protein [Acidobacteriaceae bacterium]|nr:glycoside hydrolase family 3 domain protein [Acidobacteriaceae bacterium]